jgi:hypothetical protein
MALKTTHRAFAIKQWPRFGKGAYSDEKAPATVRSSPYFWWFRFLQQNDDYDAALRGKRIKIDPSVVAAFGKVRGVDFKTWWNTHSHLFAEPPTAYSMTVAKATSDLVPFGSTKAVNLVVPLEWSAISLKRAFGKQVNKWVDEGTVRSAKRGFVLGEAEFKIGRKWHAAAMEMAYKIYVAKRQAKESGERLTWADAAIRARLPMSIGMKERDLDYELRSQRMTLSILAQRHHARAVEFVAASTTKNFP